MSQPVNIRIISLDDVKDTLDIYAPYVQNTNYTLEHEVPSLADWTNRIVTNTADYPWLVCEYNHRIVGYAYGSRHRYRAAYNWSVESTIYFNEDFHGAGIARVLYTTFFKLLRLQHYLNVYAGVILPNLKSERFHQSLGFYEVGTFKSIAYKNAAWHDTRWYQLHLSEHPANPAPSIKLQEVQHSVAFNSILENANTELLSFI